MSNEQKLREALQQALTALENVITQVKYYEECAAAIIAARQALATTEPEPTGMPELHPVAHIELGDDSHDVVTLEAAKAYGEQCWKTGYAHGAWGGDAKDAERYRWLADSNNYYEAINLISDGSLTEDALGKAIDAAMAQGVKG